jgi:hypothetical protein
MEGASRSISPTLVLQEEVEVVLVLVVMPAQAEAATKVVVVVVTVAAAEAKVMVKVDTVVDTHKAVMAEEPKAVMVKPGMQLPSLATPVKAAMVVSKVVATPRALMANSLVTPHQLIRGILVEAMLLTHHPAGTVVTTAVMAASKAATTTVRAIDPLSLYRVFVLWLYFTSFFLCLASRAAFDSSISTCRFRSLAYSGLGLNYNPACTTTYLCYM